MEGLSTQAEERSPKVEDINTLLHSKINDKLWSKIIKVKTNKSSSETLKNIIREICAQGYFKASEIAILLGKREDYIRKKFLRPMVVPGELATQSNLI